MEFKTNLFLLDDEELLEYYNAILLECCSSSSYSNEIIISRLNTAKDEILKRMDKGVDV